jgi:RHS repeat-associated protein
VKFIYDASGNRIGRNTVEENVSFLIDPNLPFAQVLEEVTNGNITVYGYGNDLFKMQGPDGTRWYTYDGLGSTRGLTDENGTLTDKYVYEGFGRLIQQTGNTRNEFLFTGEQFEPIIESYYLRARYYNQNIGRFISPDLWSGNVFHPLTIQKYSYVTNNPINYIDLSGEFFLSAVIGALQSLWIRTKMAVYSGAALLSAVYNAVRVVVRYGVATIYRLIVFGETYYSYLNRQASIAYPKLAQKGWHLHHIISQYIANRLSIPLSEITIKINPAFHQTLTNSIRQTFPFGDPFKGMSVINWPIIINKLILCYERALFPPNI